MQSTHKRKLRIGFIGLNPKSQWAATAHLPALSSLSDDFEIIGVANSTFESSKTSAEALSIPLAFASAEELITSPEIDLVVVTVKVPYHYKLVKTALEAGKHVYCEWPLARTHEEARELETLAEQKGVVAAIGTQMRTAPEVKLLRKLITQGFVGEVLSTTLVAHDVGTWGDKTNSTYEYLFDRTNGATLLRIPLAHTMAGLQDVLGKITKLSARMVNRRTQTFVDDIEKTIPKTSEDQVLIHGLLENDIPISIHYRGGVSKGTSFLWEINGTEGTILVTGDNGNAQIVQLKMVGIKNDQSEHVKIEVDEEDLKGWPEFAGARNVAHIYKLIAEDIRTGSRNAPTFKDALELHELVEQIEKSAQSNSF